MTRDEFKKLVEEKTFILDGGTGSFFIAHGMPQGVSPEAWILENPDVLMELQGGYADAGSDIVLAPTFGANRQRLKGTGNDKNIEKINKGCVELSRKATGGKTLVAADISMTGLTIFSEDIDDGETLEEGIEIYKEQAQLLIDAGVDLFDVETMISLEDARAAVRGIRAVSEDIPIMVTMTFESNQRTLYGNTPEDVVEELEAEGIDAIGANCSSGPDNMKVIIERMAACTKLPLIAKPNAGLPSTGPDGKVTYSLGAEAFA